MAIYPMQIKETKEIIIEITTPKYVTFMNKIFYGFIPIGNAIEVIYFYADLSMKLNLQIREPLDNDWEHFNLENKDTKQVTEKQFFDALHNAMLRYGVFPIPTLKHEPDDLKDIQFK